MGVVFKARHRRLDRIVALKVLPRESEKNQIVLDRFLREAQTAAKLSHPNIVAVHDSDESQGYQFLVMEFVEGKDLSITVKRGGPLAPSKAVDYIIQAAQGLEYSHEQGIIHRDIKPANILLDVNGTVKILDMGLARIEEQEDSQAELTQEGAIMGTVDYMPPEQAIDVKSVDRRADLYSLGCTLHYLLMGKPVFAGDSLLVKMLRHREETPPDLSQARDDVAPELNFVFQKLLAKSPNDRFQSATELIAELKAIQPHIAAFENSHTSGPPSLPANYADSDAYDSQSMPSMFQGTSATFETQGRAPINLSQYSPQVQMIRAAVIACFVLVSAILVYSYSGSLFSFAPDQGTLFVETSIENFGTTLKGKEVRLTHSETNTQHVITLNDPSSTEALDVGSYTIQPASEPEMNFRQSGFTIRKGQQSKLFVNWTPKQDIVQPTPVTPGPTNVQPNPMTPATQVANNQPLVLFDMEASYSGEIYPKSIAIDDLGNIYTTGFYRGTPDFSPGSSISPLKSNAQKDIFVSALDNNGNLLWAKSMGGPGDDVSQSISVGPDGNIYSTGSYYNSLNLNTSTSSSILSSAKPQKSYVSAMDRSGQSLWVKNLMENSQAIGQGVTVDGSNNVYLSGLYDGTVDSSTELNNGYLTSLYPSGSLRSNFGMGGKSLEFAPKIATDLLDRTYGAGLYQGSVRFDATPMPIRLNSSGDKDLFVLQYQQNKLTWVKQVGGKAQFKVHGTHLDRSGNVYTTGIFQGRADFDTSSRSMYLDSQGEQQFFILVHDRFGNFRWAKNYGGNEIDFSSSITFDERGNLFIAGSFTGTPNLRAGSYLFRLESEGFRDVFVLALNPQGDFSWAESLGSRYADNISDLALDKQGNLYITGTCRTAPKFKSQIESSIYQFTDAYIAKLNLQSARPIAKSMTSVTHQTPSVNPAPDTTLSTTQPLISRP